MMLKSKRKKKTLVLFAVLIGREIICSRVLFRMEDFSNNWSCEIKCGRIAHPNHLALMSTCYRDNPIQSWFSDRLNAGKKGALNGSFGVSPFRSPSSSWCPLCRAQSIARGWWQTTPWLKDTVHVKLLFPCALCDLIGHSCERKQCRCTRERNHGQ